MGYESIAETYIAAEEALYVAASRARPAVASRRFPAEKREKWYRRVRAVAKWLDTNGPEPDTVLAEIMTPYEIGIMDRLAARLPIKYQYRGLNGLREYARLWTMFPELLGEAPPQDVLELSCGACGIFDVLSRYGHNVKSYDYLDKDAKNPLGTSYAGIHKALGVACQHFDGRARPYGFAPDSFDIVLVHQALDAYGAVAEWHQIVADLLVIARRSVGLVLNPPAHKDQENREKGTAFINEMKDTYGAIVSQCPETELPTLVIHKNHN